MAEKYRKIEKSKDGVPIWDGDAGTYQEFEESALVWEQSIAVHKRSLCGPRLLTELTGTARRFTMGKHPEWLSFNGGVQRLLTHLRSNLGLPQMPELTDHPSRYFRQSRRRKGETMNEYVTRKTELYARARQGLHRVMSQYEPRSTRTWTSSARSHQGQQGPRDPWQSYTPTEAWESHYGTEADEFQEARDPLAGAADAAEDADASSRSSGHRGWRDQDWWGHSWWSPSWSPSEDAAWKTEAPELIPDYVQGWYLLFDSGLDTNERNMVVAALKGDFTLARVAQELRSQWTDEDLRRRDAAA